MPEQIARIWKSFATLTAALSFQIIPPVTMKPYPLLSAGMFAGAVVGFIAAWQIKSTTGNDSSDYGSPSRHMRTQRHPTTSQYLGKAAPSVFSQQWQEAENDEQVERKHEALLAALAPADFPALLAEMQDKAGLSGLDHPGDNQLRQLFKAWYGKAPVAALAWLSALPKAGDRQRLLYSIVDEVAESDLDRAVTMLQQYGTDDEGRIFIPDKLLEKAVVNGEEKLLEICKLGLNQGGDWPTNCQLIYPEGFDFRRVLDGLAEAQAKIGEQGRYANVPGNLISEWAKRDLKRAWAWLQEGKRVNYNGISDLIRTVQPAEAGALLAAAFNSTVPENTGYEDAVTELYRAPSAEILEAFLQAAPGERSSHLSGLFGALEGGNLGELQALLLERMSPEQRAKALSHNFKNGVDPQTKTTLTRLLIGLGHSEVEIQELLPERKE